MGAQSRGYGAETSSMWFPRNSPDASAPHVIDLTEAGLARTRLDRHAAPAPTTCAMCERSAALFQMLHSQAALCRSCFGATYAPPA